MYILGSHKLSIGYVLLISVLVNLLLLTSPFFMLLVYDKVVTTRSTETLLTLTVLALLLFTFYGVLDFLRIRILARIGVQIEHKYDRIFLNMPTQGAKNEMASSRDLDKISQFLASPLSIACIDIMWSPIFILTAFLMHPYLGVFTMVAVGLLAATALVTEFATKNAMQRTQYYFYKAQRVLYEFTNNKEMLAAFGMRDRYLDRWSDLRNKSQSERVSSGDMASIFSSTSKTLRLMAQSGILAFGCYLFVSGKIPSSFMIAGSILLGKTLSPIDQIVGNWRLMAETRKSLKAINQTYHHLDVSEPQTSIPVGKGQVEFVEVSARYAEGEPLAIDNISFKAEPGEILGIAGSSGAGKSTLVKVLMGLVPPETGKIMLDGANIEQFSYESRGWVMSYVPQVLSIFRGSIEDNISRFDDADDCFEKTVEAAKTAGVHDLIMSLRGGYQTLLPGGFSGGQLQHISLARALYKTPSVIVLDEPNSNLDGAATAALFRALRKAKEAGATIILVTHRLSAIKECDKLLILENGRVRRYGDRDQVMQFQTAGAEPPTTEEAMKKHA